MKQEFKNQVSEANSAVQKDVNSVKDQVSKEV